MKDFTISFLVDQSPSQVYHAINRVRNWWSAALEGNSEKMNDIFIYRHGDIHYSKHKIIELEQDKKIVWLTLDSHLSFAKEPSEWNGTTMIFDITKEGDKTKLVITHRGLVPQLGCFTNCSKGWTYYLQNSLLPLITTGKGNPDAIK